MFEYRQAEEVRDAFAANGVRYLFIGKSGAILLGYPGLPDTTPYGRGVSLIRGFEFRHSNFKRTPSIVDNPSFTQPYIDFDVKPGRLPIVGDE